MIITQKVIRPMMALLALLFLSAAFCPVRLWAANPLTPEVYYADPEPHVWKDGIITLYGSHDINQTQYCSDNYHFLTSSDGVHWTDPGIAFTIKDMPPGSGSLLYACDCAFRDGKYYLYISTDNGTLGVATSASPTGPFSPAQRVGGLPDRPGIDPAVFTDDDGQAYLYWGQGDNVRAAKLKPTMTEVDPATIMQPLKRAEAHFHEGSAVSKRNGIYYYVFADESRNKRPTCLGYATGPTPLGPFTYRGVIIDNNGCDPGVWNDHGRIVEFKKQWYVFHHRSIEGDRRPRQICAEPISFTADGLIPEVKMTSQGIGPPLDVCRKTAASLACLLSGTTRVTVGSEGSLCLGQVTDGDTALYRGIQFSGKPKRFSARCLVPGTAAGTLEVRLDSPAGEPVATLPVPLGSSAATWQTLSIPLHAALPSKGVHDLYLSFRGSAPISIEWFQFDP